ncbi:unnamed protein product [Leuciscus chuanchicus]
MIQISLGTATRRQTGCSRHIYVVKLSLSLRSTLSHQEVRASVRSTIRKYEGPLSEEAGLLAACGRGFSSSEYVSLVTWLSCRLSRITDSHTQESLITDDPHRCAVEVSALLKDCCCPYEGLASRIANGDVRETRDYLKVLLFVASELQAAEMEACKHSSVCVEMDSCLQELRVVCETLQLPDPAGPDAFSAVQQQNNHNADLTHTLTSHTLCSAITHTDLTHTLTSRTHFCSAITTLTSHTH